MICSRHTIEHIPDPLQFLRGINESIEGNPLIFFETPSLEWILENGAFYDFFYEHCNYFSRQSLEILFYRANFSVLEIKKSFNDQYFQIFAKVRNVDKAPNINALKIELLPYKNIAIWGAGAKGVTLANELQNAICVIDINPNKQNCFIPKCALEILSPDSAIKKHNIDLILVMNPNYEDEIKLLCKNYKIPIKCVV